MRERARSEGRAKLYDGRWRDRDPSEAPPGIKPVIRLKAPLTGETVIEDDVHIGSSTQLVAPVTVGRGATIGAGTTVWKDVPPDGLTVNTKTQVTRSDWRRPKKG